MKGSTMRKMVWLLVILVLGWTGYWFVGARGTEAAISAWIAARQGEGWQAEAAAVDTGGFPLRFDTVINAPLFADPVTGVAFAADMLEIDSGAYAPTRLTARLSEQATISTPYQNIAVAHNGAVAELFVEAGPALTLDHASVTLDQVTLSSDLGWGVTLDHGGVDSQRHGDDPLTHALSLTATGLAPSAGIMAALDPDGLVSDRFETFDAALDVTFEKAWDISALEGPRPQPRHIKIDRIAATWGKLDLRLAGAFDVDARGVAEGKIAIKATNWREMIALAESTGVLTPDLAQLATRVGGMLAGLSGNAETIDAELTLTNGMIVLGFIPLAPAPRFAIR